MRKSDQEQQAFDRLVQWAEKLAVTDVHRFHEEDHWLQDFGKVLTDSKSGQSVFFESVVRVSSCKSHPTGAA